MILYKAINKHTRKSLVIGAKNSLFNLQALVLEYKQGLITEAPEHSAGILCFRTLEQAENFVREHGWVETHLIIRVEPQDEPREITVLGRMDQLQYWLARDFSQWMDWADDDEQPIPEGTVACDAVLCID